MFDFLGVETSANEVDLFGLIQAGSDADLPTVEQLQAMAKKVKQAKTLQRLEAIKARALAKQARRNQSLTMGLS